MQHIGCVDSHNNSYKPKNLIMKKKLLRWSMVLFTAIFGATACDGIDPNMQLMYGCPNADFEVKGAVTDDAAQPIQGIKVTVTTQIDAEGGSTNIGPDTVLMTDAQGKFIASFNGFPGTSLKINAEDIDGAANGGEFAADSVVIAIAKEDYKSKDGWYAGKVEKTATISLKKK